VWLLGDRLITGQTLEGSDGNVVTAADAIGGIVAAAPIVLFAGGGTGD
jgi:hypothetical protein